jgi:hypothetical protein
MQNHLDKECPKAPDNAKSKQNVNSQVSTTSTIHTSTITPNTTTHTNIPVKRTKITKTSRIENFIDRMSEEEQEDLEFQLAQALFSTGVPFAFVDNPLVIQFFKCLWPFFKLPNRRKLADDLLNDVYNEVKLQTDEQISKAKTLCMVSDGQILIKNQYKILLFVFQNQFFLTLHFQVKNPIKENGLQMKFLNKWKLLVLINFQLLLQIQLV